MSYIVTKIEKATAEKLALKVKFNGSTVEEYYEVDLKEASDLDKHVDAVLTKASESVVSPKTETCSIVESKVKFATPVKADLVMEEIIK